MKSVLKLTWDDLLIRDFTGEEMVRWMENWTGCITGRVGLEFLNMFGVWFLRRPEGPVDMLDVFSGEVERVAETYEAFIAQTNDRAWQEIYLLSKLVYQLHEAGIIPAKGQCYAVVPHPRLGGPDPMAGDAVGPGKVTLMPVGAWQSICAQAVLSAK